MPQNPTLIRYSAGRFKLVEANLPPVIQNDTQAKQKLLLAVVAEFAHKKWGNKLPQDKFTDVNDYVYSLVENLYP